MFCWTVLILPLLIYSASTEDSKHKYDYIIVGSGAAGSILVNRLSEDPSNKVLLLEAGVIPPLLADVPAMPATMLLTEHTWKFKAVKNPRYGFGLKDQRMLLISGKMLGGSGQLNYNLYIRGNRKDYDNWAANGAAGWDWKNVFPYFKKLEDNRNPEIVANGYHGIGGDLVVQFPQFQAPIVSAYNGAAESLGYSIDDFNGPRQNVFMLPQGTVKDGRRWSTLQAFINPIIGRRNLDIVISAFVTKILIDKSKRAYGVVYEHDGKLKEAFAEKEVIICAGTYNTAKLLMLSGIGPKEELERLQIPVIMDLPVGKNLQDHASTLLHAFLVDTFTYRNDRVPKESYAEFLAFGTVLYLSIHCPMFAKVLAKIKKNSGFMEWLDDVLMQHFCDGILTTLGSVENVGFINSKYNKYPEKPDAEIVWLSSSIASDNKTVLWVDSNSNEEIWSHFEPFVNYDTVSCIPIVANPKSRGFMTLQSSNPHDDPLVDLNFYSHPDDLKIMVEGMKFCLNLSMTEPMQQIKANPLPSIVPGCEKHEQFSDEYLACMALSEPLSIFHPAGTCTMGDINDPKTVVDPTLKVKGIKGLRVVDASVIPILPAGHTYTIVTMIAEKAADMILNDTSVVYKRHVFN